MLPNYFASKCHGLHTIVIIAIIIIIVVVVVVHLR